MRFIYSLIGLICLSLSAEAQVVIDNHLVSPPTDQALRLMVYGHRRKGDYSDILRTQATVILVTDAKETCGRDLCEVDRLPEETGVNFTVHVVRFDIRDTIIMTELQVQTPDEPGWCDLQYFLHAGDRRLSAVPLTVQ